MTQLVLGSLASTAVLLLALRTSASVAPARARARRFGWRPERRRARRDHDPTDLDVASWCDAVAREVRTGSSLGTAVREGEARPSVAAVIEPIAARLSRGQSLGAALRATSTDPSSAIGLALTVLRTCADIGGPAASPLERVAATLRERDAIRQEQQSHSAQARMSARVMTLVPVGMLALLAVTDPNVRGAIGTPPGVAAVIAGAVLNLTGWWWMQRIIGRPR